jgi:hypothetical protein
MSFDRKKTFKEIIWILSSIFSSIVFFYSLVNTNLQLSFKELWLILFLVIYLPFLVFIILMFILMDYSKKYQAQYKEFLQRVIPGITGGLTVFIVAQFLTLPPSANIIDTVIPRLLNSVSYVILIFIIFLSIYIMIWESDKEKKSSSTIIKKHRLEEKTMETLKRNMSPWPGSCPLKISEWMSYLSSLRDDFDNRINHFDSIKISGIAYSATLGSLFAALTIPIAINQKYPLLMIISIIVAIFVAVIATVRFTSHYAGKWMKYQAKNRDKIQSIINSIISGEITKSDEIRQFYNQVTTELNEDSNQLIKELKLNEDW